MFGDLIPMVIMIGMFAMIFGITYIRSRENMAMIERGLNPRAKDVRPRPFINLKWGLLMIGSGLGLLVAFIVANSMDYNKHPHHTIVSIGRHHSSKNNVVVTTDTTHAPKDTSLAANTPVKNDSNDDDGDEDEHSVAEYDGNDAQGVPIYFSLIAIGGGLGLFFSYRIEKKEWIDKRKEA